MNFIANTWFWMRKAWCHDVDAVKSQKERKGDKWKLKRHSLRVYESGRLKAFRFQGEECSQCTVFVCLLVLRSVRWRDAEGVFWVLQSSYEGRQTLQRAAGQRQETAALYTGKNKRDRWGCLPSGAFCACITGSGVVSCVASGRTELYWVMNDSGRVH